MIELRSALFLLGALVLTPIFGVLVPVAGAVHRAWAFALAQRYARWLLSWVEWTCGIGYDVEGWENVPAFPVVLMSKHQSAWETVFIQARFPPQCWIVKRELLWLPFVGWGLIGIRCIAIDRSSGHNARDQIVSEGAQRLKEGIGIAIFPEGTRVAPGKRGRYHIGGALLASRTATPILPMAHNAGELWPRYAFRKRPGRVKVVIGPLIVPNGRDVPMLNAQVENWIEGQMQRISGQRHAGP